MNERDGAPAGVVEATEDGGGGPPGVVVGCSGRNEKPVPRAGVDGLPGGLLSTINLAAMMQRSYITRALQASGLDRPTRRVAAASLFAIEYGFALLSHTMVVLGNAMDGIWVQC